MSGFKVKGEVRTRFAKRTAGDFEVRQTGFESLAMAQVEPACLEMTRANARFLLGNSAAVTGIAPAQALPTTAAQWAIFNSEPAAGGKTYFLEELGMFLASGTPGVGGILLACIYQTPAIVGANRAGCSVSAAGKPGNAAASTSDGSKAIIAVSQTITNPATPNWFPVTENSSPNVTAFAGSVFLSRRDLAGAIAIPPQYALGLAVVAPAGTTPLFAPFARWVELATDNE